MNWIPEARQWWRLWSVRLNGIALALLMWVQIDPSATLAVWVLMPEPIRALLPESFVMWISVILFVLALLARFVVQPKLRLDRDEGDGPWA